MTRPGWLSDSSGTQIKSSVSSFITAFLLWWSNKALMNCGKGLGSQKFGGDEFTFKHQGTKSTAPQPPQRFVSLTMPWTRELSTSNHSLAPPSELRSGSCYHLKKMKSQRKEYIFSFGWEVLVEKEVVTHSNILPWKIPWTEKPGRLQSMGLQRVAHNWSDLASMPGRF